ncbi:MAG: adenine phosphoribosyltransferase [Clostridia bacterium]|nr:adenine phosphoribosyltransferase [Clostridia bacterium]
MDKFFTVDIKGYKADLPILTLPSGINIAFFNLHGAPALTEHCGKQLAKLCDDCDVLITAESKGLQLTHVVARELNMPFYAVARKSKKLYIQDGVSVAYGSSITTGKAQELFLSKHDVDLLKGKNVCIVDDVISTGESLKGLEDLVKKAGGNVYKKIFVLAEGDAKDRADIEYLAHIPLL